MPNTYTQFNMHIVFSVKNRENFLSEKIRPELFRYIAGIINNKKHYSLAVNGHKDHVHLFFEYNPSFSVSDLIRDIKSGSSKWLNEHNTLFPENLAGRKAMVVSHIQNHKEIQ